MRVPALGPYRSPAASTAEAGAVEPSRATPLAPIGLLVLVAATSRVAVAAWTREEFTAEPTLALLVSVLLAVWVVRAARPSRA